jgi:hypothetical protein
MKYKDDLSCVPLQFSLSKPKKTVNSKGIATNYQYMALWVHQLQVDGVFGDVEEGM